MQLHISLMSVLQADDKLHGLNQGFDQCPSAEE